MHYIFLVTISGKIQDETKGPKRLIMPHVKSRWGLFFFLCAPALAGALVWISLRYPFAHTIRLYTRVIPALGLIFSIIAFFIGQVSYPRVHNLKVYLIGYGTGVWGLGYFLFFQSPVFLPFPPAPCGYLTSLYLLIGGNFLITLLVPSYVKYRTARHVVMAVITAQCVVLLATRFSAASLPWTHSLNFSHCLSLPLLIGVLTLLCILLVSVVRLKNEFHLGGILAGGALLYAVAWTSHAYLTSFNSLQCLVFAAAPLFLEIGILVHWFLRMEHRIAYDPLLHIYNRDYCSKIISEQSNLNLTAPLAVAMVDIDHFKNVNDTYGHQAGDQVLYTVAQTVCREVLPAGVVCRYGGEELIVFFPQKTIAQAEPIVENMRKILEKTKTKTAKKSLAVTVSCGISCREEAQQSIMEVIQAADKALYKAKEGGRNQVKLGKTASMAIKKK